MSIQEVVNILNTLSVPCATSNVDSDAARRAYSAVLKLRDDFVLVKKDYDELSAKYAKCCRDLSDMIDSCEVLTDDVNNFRLQRDSYAAQCTIANKERDNAVKFLRADIVILNQIITALKKQIASEPERYKALTAQLEKTTNEALHHTRTIEQFADTMATLLRERDLWKQRALAKPPIDTINVSVTVDTARMVPVIEALQQACACVEAQPVSQPGVAAAYLALQHAIKMFIETPPNVTSKEQ